MQENTVLATPFQSSSTKNLNFHAFLKCKPYLAAKDNIIFTSIAQKIAETIDLNQGCIRILDVGSGKGTLINYICSKLLLNTSRKTYPNTNIFIDCVEPCIEGIVHVRTLVTKVASYGVYVQPYQTTIETFLTNEKSSSYDVIVCCHTLYHIERKNWMHILESLVCALRSKGVLVVNLVSRESEVYHIKEQIETKKSLSNLHRLYDSYGFEYYAEDLKDALRLQLHKWKQETIFTEIVFTRREVLEAISSLQDKTNNSSLLHFLAFMFRLHYNDFRTIARTELLNLFTRNSNGMTLKSLDKMFIIKKIYPK